MMKKRFFAITAAIIFCISMLPIASAAAAAPAIIGTLEGGKLTVSATGLASDTVQVNFLAVNTADENDKRMDTATVSGNTASVTFTVKGADYKISATAVSSNLSESALTPIEVKAKAKTYIGVKYASYVQKVRWQNFVKDGALSGTTGRSLRDEAVKIKLAGAVPAGASIIYQAKMQRQGWQKAVSNGAAAGAAGKSLRLEALRITLCGMTGYEVQYRAFVQNKGWMNWQTVKNGTNISKAGAAGMTGKSNRVEAVKILVKKVP